MSTLLLQSDYIVPFHDTVIKLSRQKISRHNFHIQSPTFNMMITPPNIPRFEDPIVHQDAPTTLRDITLGGRRLELIDAQAAFDRGIVGKLAVAERIVPTRIIFLTNFISDVELRNTGDFEDIKSDIHAECENYGEVRELLIPRPKPFPEYEEDDEEVGFGGSSAPSFPGRVQFIFHRIFQRIFAFFSSYFNAFLSAFFSVFFSAFLLLPCGARSSYSREARGVFITPGNRILFLGFGISMFPWSSRDRVPRPPGCVGLEQFVSVCINFFFRRRRSS